MRKEERIKEKHASQISGPDVQISGPKAKRPSVKEKRRDHGQDSNCLTKWTPQSQSTRMIMVMDSVIADRLLLDGCFHWFVGAFFFRSVARVIHRVHAARQMQECVGVLGLSSMELAGLQSARWEAELRS